MMIYAAFNIGILTILFFVIGMIKPQWPLFFLKKPDRFWILAISTVLFMITMTLYGEGNRRAKLEQAPKHSLSQDAAPVPVPESAPAKPAE
ncbi:hypothetical protein [Methylobacter sp. BlB1]|uniref:hypothetical protein n=1 Tax=unclassified Methylobacter TaxID=2635283 RepID=UPI001E5D4039|nr:hypothetical protein [Methylobacter sp. BlB1]